MHPIVGSLIAFLAAAGLLTITPGLDTALVLRTAAAEGPRRASFAALGIAAGCLGWAVLVAVGLGALLAASPVTYAVLKWIGAGYLVWLGARMLLKPRRAFDPAAPPGGRASDGAAFLKGALTNALNPKVGVFYVSFLPQFVPSGAPVGPFVLLLGVLHVILGLVWFACLIGLTRPISTALRRSGLVQALDRLTGGVFIAFGVGLAIHNRPA